MCIYIYIHIYVYTFFKRKRILETSGFVLRRKCFVGAAGLGLRAVVVPLIFV